MNPVLHVLTDETLQSRFSHKELAQQISDNGAHYIQFREKRQIEPIDLCRTASIMQSICRDSDRSKLVVNDHVEVAYAVFVSAVHLGKEDTRIRTARTLLGQDAYIGGTANSLEEARLQCEEPLDYIGVGPVYGTTSKANPAATLGIEGLAAICSISTKPVIAIGNIQSHNVAEVIDAGAAGIAVLSAIVCSDDPGQTTGEFVRALEEC